MKHSAWLCLAFSSVLLGALANAATRPQYGGTLRLAMRSAPTSLDPADLAQGSSFSTSSVSGLMFDTLVTLNRSGRAEARLAVSWQASPGMQRWQLRLRHGVRFHDGTALTPEIAAGSLRTANPAWNVSFDAESITIELAASDPELLSELALPRNAIEKKNPGSAAIGTGPFHVVDWQPGNKLTLGAEENCWRGRPFLDGIEIEMGRSYRDQLTEFELGKAEWIEVAPEQLHRVASEGRHVESSLPVELLAILFSQDASSADKSLRQALAFSIERGSIHSVLLQGAGQATAGILPSWMSGYGFVFPTDADLPRARQFRAQLQSALTWTVSYDANDPLDRLLVERIALNARDAGLSLQPSTSTNANLRLMHTPLSSLDPWVALADLDATNGLPASKARGGSVEDLYAEESADMAALRLIPLFHLPASYGIAPAVRDWTLHADGTWNMADAWLGSGKP